MTNPERTLPAEETGAELPPPAEGIGDENDQNVEIADGTEQTAEGPARVEVIDDRRLDQIKEQAKLSREAHFENLGIARSIDYFKSFGEKAPQSLTNVLENKKCFGFNKVGGERPAETVANELLNDVEPLIEGLRKELEGSNLKPEQIEQGIIAIREMLYGLVTKEIISGGKVKDLVGSIRFQQEPDTSERGEAHGQRTESSKIKGMSVYNNETGRFDIFFYGAFFSNTSEEGQSYLARHEFSHVLAEGTNLFDAQTYARFKEYAGNPNITDEQIAEIASKAPELAEILQMMRNPEASKGVWNGYIRSRIEKLATLSGDELIDERKAVASELVADMIAPYLDSGEDEVSYLSKRFETLDQDQLLALVMAQAKKPDGSICKNGSELVDYFRARGVEIDTENMTPQELIASFARIPEFSSVFGAHQKFYLKLQKSFDRRGEAITADSTRKYSHEEEELADFDDLMDFSEYYDQYYGTSASAGGKMGKPAGPPQENFFTKFWNFITAKNSGPKTLTPSAALNQQRMAA